MMKKSTFALFFGNRGFFPGSLITSAREELVRILKNLGHETIVLDADSTRFGAVETPAEGEVYARLLEEHRGRFDGIILSLPNFGDENGAVVALRDARVPILIQAYPDDLDKMAPTLRRDAFCGKLSVMDVFFQNGIKFTALKPHTISPGSAGFASNVDHFDRVCRVVKALRRMTIGAIGARTSAFKTVRIDEVALQRSGITMETFDLSDIFLRISETDVGSTAFKDKAQLLKSCSDFSSVPETAVENIVKLGVVLDSIIDECNLDAIALRCWVELQQQLGISSCVIMSELNDRLISAACEVDVGSAVAMHALNRASGEGSACLDWNNNYGDDQDKCILFHCGQVPRSLMQQRGQVMEHAILANAVGNGCSFGCNVGRIKPTPFTFGGMMTDCGGMKFYLGEGHFTEDTIPEDFFGCAGVAHISSLQDVLLHVGHEGHRHHVSVTPQHVAAPLRDALECYLGHQVSQPQFNS